jgi:tetratricopeptide (TPR) repeat protein
MSKKETYQASNQATAALPPGVTQPLVFLLVLTVILLSTGNILAQERAPEPSNDLVPALAPAPRSIATIDAGFGAYDQGQIESLGDLARMSHSTGEHHQALMLFKQALHVSRINLGLYHEAQIPIIDDIISAEIALKNWEEVNNYYDYQEHLYRRLYALDDPRLEVGLKKVSAWHITALNVNLDGNRIEHLRKANHLFKLRKKVAENTLALDDPTFTMLSQNIKLLERELFLSSDLNREMQVKQKRDQLASRNSLRQDDRRMVGKRD